MSGDVPAPAQLPGLALVGDPDAGVCDGDSCLLPAQAEAHADGGRADQDLA